ncbi:MAG: glycosyltransferase family 2 protein [Dysgonamonadaceae bacterium]|jgi:GT2 family glycosyltransferase|nr:glycosyltransferase family 2 protein [Dysgonamonadaceae bacterium]
MKKIAVVILNWNGKSLLEKFLPPLLAYTSQDIADLIVANNASTDGSVDFIKSTHPEIQLIQLDKNYGFAEGYNRIIAQLEYQYVVLLNSDVEVTPNWLEPALNYLETHPDIVALQPKILSYKDKTSFEYAGACGGYLDVYGYPFCRGRILHVVEKDTHQYESCVDILWASGACLFVKTEEYKNAGGLDPSFFAHQEEIDFCWRLASRGKRIVCLPTSVVYHVGGATLSMENPKKTFLNFRNNLLMIYKNMPEKQLRNTLRVRFFLDILAALVFFLKRERGNLMAVFNARKEFRKNKKQYEQIRKDNLSKSLSDLPPQIYRKSIIFAFYCRNIQKFSELNI